MNIIYHDKYKSRMTTGETLAARLREIADASGPGPGVTRLPWTEAHRVALGRIQSWMEAAGLDPSLDAAGTLIGRSPNPRGKPVLLIGSHQDSVPSGGAYDGIMGVAVGCSVAESLKDDLPDFPFALEVMAFADEEGVRFPTALIGPRALAGTLAPEALEMQDRDGVVMSDAMAAFGCDPREALMLKREASDILGYLEIHIEQGPVLEIENCPTAAVSAICGISRHTVTVTGETGHAGTVPMAGRRDALVAASRVIARISETAASRGDIRATVGTLSISPGAVKSEAQTTQRARHSRPRHLPLPVKAAARRVALRRPFAPMFSQLLHVIPDSPQRLKVLWRTLAFHH